MRPILSWRPPGVASSSSAAAWCVGTQPSRPPKSPATASDCGVTRTLHQQTTSPSARYNVRRIVQR